MLYRIKLHHNCPRGPFAVCQANPKANETGSSYYYDRQVANLRKAGGRLLSPDDLTGVNISSSGEFLDDYIQQQLLLCTQPRLLNQAPGAQQYKGPRLGLNSAAGGAPVLTKPAIGLTIPPPRATSRAGPLSGSRSAHSVSFECHSLFPYNQCFRQEISSGSQCCISPKKRLKFGGSGSRTQNQSCWKQ